MTVDLTQAQEYRRELEDALATLREAGDLGQYVNTPPTGSGNSAKLNSVAGAAIFVASHIWALAYRDRLGESPLYAFSTKFESREWPEPTAADEARREQLRAVHREVDDLALTMASPPTMNSGFVGLHGQPLPKGEARKVPHEYNPDFEGAIKKGSGL